MQIRNSFNICDLAFPSINRDQIANSQQLRNLNFAMISLYRHLTQENETFTTTHIGSKKGFNKWQHFS